jgi:hypothetical protein
VKEVLRWNSLERRVKRKLGKQSGCVVAWHEHLRASGVGVLGSGCSSFAAVAMSRSTHGWSTAKTRGFRLLHMRPQLQDCTVAWSSSGAGGLLPHYLRFPLFFSPISSLLLYSLVKVADLDWGIISQGAATEQGCWRGRIQRAGP